VQALSDFEISECVLKMFYDLDLVQSYRMSHETVCKFIMSVANGYRSTVQYHNWRHGFTVAHFAYSLAKLTPLQNHLLKHEICALFVAALCHDIDHRGRTNTFMANQNTSIGQLYGAVSTMEKHHLDMTNLLLSHAELDIFGIFLFLCIFSPVVSRVDVDKNSKCEQGRKGSHPRAYPSCDLGNGPRPAL